MQNSFDGKFPRVRDQLARLAAPARVKVLVQRRLDRGGRGHRRRRLHRGELEAALLAVLDARQRRDRRLVLGQLAQVVPVQY